MAVITGTAGSDTLVGTGIDDTIVGLGGNDVLEGRGGFDILQGGDGDDRFVVSGVSAGPVAVIEGGTGFDTLDLSGYNLSFYFFAQPLTIQPGPNDGFSLSAFFYQRGGGGVSQVVATTTSIERIILGVGTPVALGDYATALTIETTGKTGEGIQTGRGDDTIILNPVGGTYGGSTVDAGAGADTLVLSGVASDYLFQRSATGWSVYDGPGSIHRISNVEAVRIGGAAATTFEAAAAIDFNAAGYLSRYADLRAAYGTDDVKAFQHYQQYGEAEGRTTVFDGLAYIAGYADLRAAFGPDADAGLQHFAEHGAAEGRSILFNPAEYAAAYVDLARIIGADAAAASTHYIVNGVNEGRTIGGFDSVAYLLGNPDLAGMTPVQARDHWLRSGADEGRAGDAPFGREQATHAGFSGNTDFNVTVGLTSDFNGGADKDWFTIDLMNGLNYVIDGTANVGGLAIYDRGGHLVASDADGQNFAFKPVISPGILEPVSYYLVVTGAGQSGSYTVSSTLVFPPSSSPEDAPVPASAPAEIGTSAAPPGDPFHDPHAGLYAQGHLAQGHHDWLV